MSLDHDIDIMVGETVAGNVCGSATRWNRVVTISGLVLQRRLATLTFPLTPFLAHAAGEEGGG